MKTFVIGDIHGGLLAVKQVLERAKVIPTDKLIFLGDFVDGWSQSPQVLDFLIHLKQTNNCIFIRGNHDELLYDWLTQNHQDFNEKMWFKHGGEATALAYKTVNSETKNRHIEFLKSLQNYHLDNLNRLFIHAGFTNLKGIDFEYFSKLFYWDRTLWETAISLDKNIGFDSNLYPKRLKIYSEIYIGHTPVTKINCTVPTQKACVWNLDTGAGFQGKLSILEINSKQFWQSDPLPKLYPKEMGRTQ